MEPSQAQPSSLNSNHLRRLLISCQYIDKLLSDIESVLNQSSSSDLFKKYRDDLSPMQRKVTRDYIARIRARLARVLDEQNVALPEADIGAAHSVRTALDFIDISAEELEPKYMRGYGEVPESAVPELNGIVSELQGLVQKLNSYLWSGLAQNWGQACINLQFASIVGELATACARPVQITLVLFFYLEDDRNSRRCMLLDHRVYLRLMIASFYHHFFYSGRSSPNLYRIKFCALG